MDLSAWKFLQNSPITPKKRCKKPTSLEAVNRPNVMIKVSHSSWDSTIRQLIGEGLNINITMMFSMEHYVQVAEAYVRGLAALEKKGRLLSVGSVASFFVSRVDTQVDKLLDEQILQASRSRETDELKSLFGQTAIANSKLVYQRFKQIFGSPRFQSLKAKGPKCKATLGQHQHQNPSIETLYAEELVGPDTVDTIPRLPSWRLGIMAS